MEPSYIKNMFWFALRNLFQHKLRFFTTLFGVIFSITLVVIQVGVLLGFLRLTSIIVEKSPGDLWICPPNAEDFTSSEYIDKKYLYRVKGTKGISWAEPLIIGWGLIKKPDGTAHFVQCISYDTTYGVGKPWSMIEGNLQDTKLCGNVIIDESSRIFLKTEFPPGTRLEIANKQAKIVGISQGARSFSTYPYVFCSQESVKRFSYIPDDKVSYIVAGISPGESIDSVKQRLQEKLKGLTVYKKQEFMNRIQSKWLLQTGMGLAILFNTLLALVVGVVIVGQNIYATTLEKIREFAILKALGASNFELFRVVFYQAIVYAIPGYLLATLTSLMLAQFYQESVIPVVVPMWAWGAIFIITCIMCLLGASLSLYRLTKVDPAIAFRE